MAYKIGSFNMYKFQAYRSDEIIKKDLDMLKYIIAEEQFDIVAMQEILGETPMNMILKRLGSSWKGAWGKPNSKSEWAAEGMKGEFNWQKARRPLEREHITLEYISNIALIEKQDNKTWLEILSMQDLNRNMRTMSFE
jgi:hypothetical protein